MKDDSTLSMVVLPVPVPPETRMLQRASTQALRKPTASLSSVPNLTRSSTLSGSFLNLRIVSKAPSSASGAITALTREPSSRRASQSGLSSSMRRPTDATIRPMVCTRCSSLSKRAAVNSILPPRSTQITSGPLTMISLMLSSSRNAWIGPSLRKYSGSISARARRLMPSTLVIAASVSAPGGSANGCS